MKGKNGRDDEKNEPNILVISIDPDICDNVKLLG
jgi:hypothetical protein